MVREKRSGLAVVLALALSTSGYSNLLRNPGAEEFGNPVPGPGVRPAYWYLGFGSEDQADGYSNDGSIGLHPSFESRFIGATSYDGTKFVGIRSRPGFVTSLTIPMNSWREAFNKRYRFECALRQHTSPLFGTAPQIDVFLNVSPEYVFLQERHYLGRLSPPEHPSIGWGVSSVEKEIYEPSWAESITLEITGGNQSALVGIDRVSLVEIPLPPVEAIADSVLAYAGPRQTTIEKSFLRLNDNLPGGAFTLRCYSGTNVFVTDADQYSPTVRIAPQQTDRYLSGEFGYTAELYNYTSVSARVAVTFDLPNFWIQTLPETLLNAHINDFGSVAGTLLVNGVERPWVDGTEPFHMSPPPAARINAINNSRGYAGSVTQWDGSIHPMMSTRPGTLSINPYSVVESFSPLGGEILDLNDNFGAVGWATLANGEKIAAQWIEGVISPVGPSASSSRAVSIDNLGRIFGDAIDVQGKNRVFAWRDGAQIPLEVPSGWESFALGEFCGYVRDPQGRESGALWNQESGALTILPTLPGSQSRLLCRQGGTTSWDGLSFRAFPESSNLIKAWWPNPLRPDPFAGSWTHLEDSSNSTRHYIYRGVLGAGPQLFAVRTREKDDWERQRGIGDVSLVQAQIVGGQSARVNYQGDSTGMESVIVRSDRPDIVPIQQLWPQDGQLRVRTTPVEAAAEVNLTFDFSFSEDPLGSLSLTVLPSKFRRLVGTWNRSANGGPGAVQGMVTLNSPALLNEVRNIPIRALSSGIFTAETHLPSGVYTVRLDGRSQLAQVGVITLGNEQEANLTIDVVLGDVDDDDAITVFDYIALSDSFDSSPGEPNWDPRCDLDLDGSITVFDYIILSLNFDRSTG